MKSFYFNLILFLCVVLFISCHTTIFHNVNKRLQGSWTRTPVGDTLNPDSLPTWTFENGALKITNSVYTGDWDPFAHYASLDSIKYAIVNSMTRNLLFFEYDVILDEYNFMPDSLKTPELKEKYSVRVVEKYQVLKISKTYLYLSKIASSGADYLSGQDMGDNGGYVLNGGVQVGFIRK
jgi:hypothetical protein